MGPSMIIKHLPNSDSHERLFFNYKHQNECLGLATVNKDMLSYDTVGNIKNEIKEFLTTGLFTSINWDNISVDNFEQYKNEYKVPIENYCKLVWLTKDYITNQSFKNPLGVHWDTRENKWVIHPGGSRQKVIDLFHTGPLEILAFNTGGIELNFDRVFLNYTELKNYFKQYEMYLCVVADQGSLIPHVHFNKNDTIINEVHRYYLKLKKFFAKTNLVANFDLTEFGYTVPRKYRNTINITIKDSTSLKQQIQALCLVPSFDTFNNYGVKIERT